MAHVMAGLVLVGIAMVFSTNAHLRPAVIVPLLLMLTLLLMGGFPV